MMDSARTEEPEYNIQNMEKSFCSALQGMAVVVSRSHNTKINKFKRKNSCGTTGRSAERARIDLGNMTLKER